MAWLPSLQVDQPSAAEGNCVRCLLVFLSLWMSNFYFHYWSNLYVVFNLVIDITGFQLPPSQKKNNNNKTTATTTNKQTKQKNHKRGRLKVEKDSVHFHGWYNYTSNIFFNLKFSLLFAQLALSLNLYTCSWLLVLVTYILALLQPLTLPSYVKLKDPVLLWMQWLWGLQAVPSFKL